VDSDEALMERVQRDDEDAFEALFHRYRRSTGSCCAG
jgi:hypothetical protein